MATIAPPSITALPSPPDPANRATFNTLAYPWSAALPTFSTEVSAVAANVKANADDAATSSTTATAKAAEAVAAASAATTTANASAWVNGGTYALNDNAISGVDFQTYRKKTASSVTSTDPSADGANWVQVGGSTIGAGGTTSTASITLTASSAAAMTVTPATPGLYVTLPDATTCTKADNLYAVYNAGDYDYGVKDSAGTQLGWIRARTGAMIGLADNSTAAGVWAYYGLEKTGITASYVNSTLTNMGSTIRRIALDANRTCFLFGGTYCYAIVYDASTQTWGSATLVRASVASGAFIGVLSATDQVLVCSCSSTTAFEAVTLTIATNTVTVNTGTKATATLSGNWAAFGQLIPVSTSWVVSYLAVAVDELRAITVSGTTPTIGSASSVIGSAAISPIIFASGSIVRCIGNSTTAVRARPFTVSGSTLSAGTHADVTTTASGARAFLNGNGNIVCHYINSTHYATIFKLTGTVEAASSVSLGTALTSVTAHADYVAVTTSKTAFVWHASSTTWYANVLTDTAGTATAGTAISGAVPENMTVSMGLAASGNNARFAIKTTGSNGVVAQLTLDCSGASAVLSNVQQISYYTSPNGGTNNAALLASDGYGVRQPRLLIAGTRAHVAGGAGAVASDYSLLPQAMNLTAALPVWAKNGNVKGVVGSSSNESFVSYPTDSSTIGMTIQRIEAAA